MKFLLLLFGCFFLLQTPSGAQDEQILIPSGATALVAIDPVGPPDFLSGRAIQLDLEALSQELAPAGAVMSPRGPGSGPLKIQGAESIGFIGRTDSNGDPRLVGMESAGGARIVVTNTATLTAFEVPMSENDFNVIASVNVGETVFALLRVFPNATDVESSLRRVKQGHVEKLLVFKTTDEPIDMTYLPNGDLVVLVRTLTDDPVQYPKLLRISQDGAIVWKNRYNSALTSISSPPKAFGVVNGAGEDAVLLVGSSGSVPWIMKVAGDGKPIWEKSYLYGSLPGEFYDGAAGSDGFALVGSAYMRNESPEALVAKMSADGTLAWMRGCGGLASDKANSAAFTADGGVLVTGATKSKERATRSDFETDTWVMSIDKDGWLVWETTLGPGGAAVVAWENGVTHAATDRRTVGSFVLRPSFGSELDWQVPQVYPFVPRNLDTPAAMSEGAATCFDIVAQIKLAVDATSDRPEFAETLRDLRLRKN
jgi:hypothetical protein